MACENLNRPFPPAQKSLILFSIAITKTINWTGGCSRLSFAFTRCDCRIRSLLPDGVCESETGLCGAAWVGKGSPTRLHNSSRFRSRQPNLTEKEQVMAETAHPPRTSFISRKLSLLVSRLRDPEWRRYGYLLLAGKALGLVVLFMAITMISGIFFSKVLAAAAPVKPSMC